jgi:hypothetical protein
MPPGDDQFHGVREADDQRQARGEPVAPDDVPAAFERAYREFRGDPPLSPIDSFSLIAGVFQFRRERWPERA